MATYIEPIEHPRAQEARQKGMTVEQLLEIEKKNSQPGVIIKDHKDAYQNMQAAVKNNPNETARQKEGEVLAKQKAARAANLLLAPTLPSTYVGLSTGALDYKTGEAKNTIGGQLWRDTRLIQDLAIPGMVGLGINTAKQLGNKITLQKVIRNFNNSVDSKVFPTAWQRVELNPKYLYHREGFSKTRPYQIGDSRYGASIKKGSLIVNNKGNLVSLNPVTYPGQDLIWWDRGGEGIYDIGLSSKLRVKPITGKDVPIQQAFNQFQLRPYQNYQQSYFVTPSESTNVDDIVTFIRQPDGSIAPYSTNKVLTNKMSLDEIFSQTPAIQAIISSKPTTKTSLAFFEHPSKLTEAEKLGIPKGERRSYLLGSNADPSYYGGMGLHNQNYLQRLRDFHFLQKAPNTVLVNTNDTPARLYHGTPIRGWHKWDKTKFGSSTDIGMYGEGIYTTSHKNYANVYALNNTPDGKVVGEIKEVYGNAENPFYIYWKGISPLKSSQRYDAAYQFGRQAKVQGNVPDDMWHEMVNSDAVIEEYGLKRPNFSEVVFPSNGTQIKYASPVTYDNAGKIIPLSKRDNFKINDWRYKSGGKINYLNFFK